MATKAKSTKTSKSSKRCTCAKCGKKMKSVAVYLSGGISARYPEDRKSWGKYADKDYAFCWECILDALLK